MISRSVKEGFRGIGRHWGMSISSALAVMITLIIISLFLMVSYNITLFTKSIESSVEISATVSYDYESQEAENKIRIAIEKIDGVASVTYSDKEAEFDYYLDSFDDEKTKEAMEPFREYNSMHDAFYIEAEDGDMIQDIAAEIEKIEGIDKVNYGGQSTLSVVSAMSAVRQVGAALVAGLSLLAIFLIANTIKLTISARQDEIFIMRNVGATDGFIRAPFVVEGILTGILGSIIPIGLTIFGYMLVYEKTGGVFISNMFRLAAPSPFIYYLSGILLGIGVMVGLIGSWVSVTKYLRWNR